MNPLRKDFMSNFVTKIFAVIGLFFTFDIVKSLLKGYVKDPQQKDLN